MEALVNVETSQLTPGVFGVSHGSGIAGEIIRDATGSWAGHAVLYLGGGVILSGQPPQAVQIPADSFPDAIWAWRMWAWLAAPRVINDIQTSGWPASQVSTAQAAVVARGHELIGGRYDFLAYPAFAAEVLHLRNEGQLAGWFSHDPMRVCSADVADALAAGGVPLDFVPGDGPGLVKDPGTKVKMPPNLVAPGMLLGLAQRLEWT